MSDKLYIVCVDDQREVLDAVLKDISPLAGVFTLEACESAEECDALMAELDAQGGLVALVIADHLMPGRSGVELLSQMARDPRFAACRKVLLTGQASHSDTIEAVNAARIDHYFEKPWDRSELIRVCRRLVTEFILQQGLDYDDYVPLLDQETLYKNLR